MCVGKKLKERKMKNYCNVAGEYRASGLSSGLMRCKSIYTTPLKMSGGNAEGRRRDATIARRDENLGVKNGLEGSKYTFARILIRRVR